MSNIIITVTNGKINEFLHTSYKIVEYNQYDVMFLTVRINIFLSENKDYPTLQAIPFSSAYFSAAEPFFAFMVKSS